MYCEIFKSIIFYRAPPVAASDPKEKCFSLKFHDRQYQVPTLGLGRVPEKKNRDQKLDLCVLKAELSYGLLNNLSRIQIVYEILFPIKYVSSLLYITFSSENLKKHGKRDIGL